jgi:hypothetical protein
MKKPFVSAGIVENRFCLLITVTASARSSIRGPAISREDRARLSFGARAERRNAIYFQLDTWKCSYDRTIKRADHRNTCDPTITGFQPLRPRDRRPLIFRIAHALYPAAPVAWLASIADHRRGGRKFAYSTAKTWAYGFKHWAYGSRKPPMELFKKLKGLLQDALPTHEDQRVVIELSSLLDQYIWLEGRKAARPRTGFNEIRPRDGPCSTPRDGRNRRGRPKKRNSRNPEQPGSTPPGANASGSRRPPNGLSSGKIPTRFTGS